MNSVILPVTLTGAGIAALINLWLAIRIGRVRSAEKISIGDGGSDLLTRRMRAHANFVEYTPFVLILIGVIELATGTSMLLWAVMAIYMAARIAHAFGMDGVGPARGAGITVTMLTLVGLALYALSIPFTMQGQISDTTLQLDPAG